MFGDAFSAGGTRRLVLQFAHKGTHRLEIQCAQKSTCLVLQKAFVEATTQFCQYKYGCDQDQPRWIRENDFFELHRSRLVLFSVIYKYISHLIVVVLSAVVVATRIV